MSSQFKSSLQSSLIERTVAPAIIFLFVLVGPAQAAIYFSDDMETGDWAPFNGGAGWNQTSIGSGSAMSGVTSPVRNGSYAGRAFLKSGGQRSEKAKFGCGYLKTNQERWYGFSIYVPADFQQASGFAIVHQVRVNADSGEPDQSPFISLEIRNGATEWQLYNRWDDQALSTGLSGGAGGSITTTNVMTEPLTKGVWTDFVFRIKYDYRDPALGPCDGILQVWMNTGEGYDLVVDRQNLPNCYNNDNSAHLKLGFYNPGGFSGDKTLYYDEFRISTADTGSFAEVEPQPVRGGSAASIGPVADAYVQDGSSGSSNFGANSLLIVKDVNTSGQKRWAYLKFDVSSTGGAVDSAILDLTTANPNGSTLEIYGVPDDSWTEGGITWNNKPSVGVLLDTVTYTGATGQVVSFDITEHVNNQIATDNVASVAVREVANGNTYLTYGSRESTTPPALNVTVSQSERPPVADAYVQDGSSAGSNFGSATSLIVKDGTTGGQTREAYFKFDLSDLVGAPTTAMLSLVTGSPNAGTVKIYSVPNDAWTESGVTWNNRPAKGVLLDTIEVPAQGGVEVSFDVSAYVGGEINGDGTVSFVVLQENDENVYMTFGSRESVNPPLLLLVP